MQYTLFSFRFSFLALVSIVLVSGSPILQSDAQSSDDRMVFETSDPELIPNPDWMPALLDQAQYDQFVEKQGKRDFIVIIDELPDINLLLIGYGFNFIIDGINRSFAVFGTPHDGYWLYADVNANGSLADEEGWNLEPDDGRYSVAFQTTVSGQAQGRPVDYLVKSRFVFAPDEDSEADRPRGVWNSNTIRRGEIRTDEEGMSFALYGRVGEYNDRNQKVWFDLDGDDKGDDSRESPEVFRVLDEYVNIDGTSYAFRVDPYGRHISLSPLDEARPERPVLSEGSAAPAFEAEAVDGVPVELSGLPESIVLLNFWAGWCGPCRNEARKLAELNQRFAEHSLKIVGITTDSEDEIDAFVTEFDHTWPQISEAFEGPVHRAYRVVAYPTKYLIDQNGDLLCGGPGPSFWESCWPQAEKMLTSDHD